MHGQNWVNFYKVTPGGNTTLLLDASAVLPAERAGISAQIMDSLHLGAEQVGFVEFHNSLQPVPFGRLDMMGGEFCGNACRAYAAVLAYEKFGDEISNMEWTGKVLCSGLEQPVSCWVKGKDSGLDSAIAVPFDSKYEMTLLQDGKAVLRLPGITHILLPYEAGLRTQGMKYLAALACGWRKKLGLLDESAVGCIWFELTDKGASILPLVWVKETNTSCAETACGSASIALGLFMGSRGVPSCRFDVPHASCSGCNTVYRIKQPSGHSLWVAYNSCFPDWPEHIYLGGVCKITARGQVNLG